MVLRVRVMNFSAPTKMVCLCFFGTLAEMSSFTPMFRRPIYLAPLKNPIVGFGNVLSMLNKENTDVKRKDFAFFHILKSLTTVVAPKLFLAIKFNFSIEFPKFLVKNLKHETFTHKKVNKLCIQIFSFLFFIFDIFWCSFLIVFLMNFMTFCEMNLA